MDANTERTIEEMRKTIEKSRKDAEELRRLRNDEIVYKELASKITIYNSQFD